MGNIKRRRPRCKKGDSEVGFAKPPQPKEMSDTCEGDAEEYRRAIENPEEYNRQQQSRMVEPGQKQAVGYGRPPMETRWKPGQSGNPFGRRSGSKNLRTAIEEMLTDKITIREEKRIRRVTRLEAVLLKQLSLALKGDHRAFKAVYSSANEFGLLKARPEELVVGDLRVLTDDELRELERLLLKVDGRVVA